MYNYSEGNSFDAILNRMLANVPDTLDKREGSIIYDALAPAAAELAQCYINLSIFSEQTYLLDANGVNLDNRVAEVGLTRLPATSAEVLITVYNTSEQLMDVDIGTRFSAPNDKGGYTYQVTERVSLGNFKAICETLGNDGGSYVGELLPISSINNLGAAVITSVVNPGEDVETDAELRERALIKLNQEAFAGNKAAYRELAIGINGVKDCKVFPVWDGGGTVELALIGPNHTLLSSGAIAEIQEMIDPSPQGTGIGMAPIGHTVTVTTPTAQNISISATLTLDSSVQSISAIQDAVEEEIGKYIYQVQEDFITKDTLIIYISKISAAILNVAGIINVSSVQINGSGSDLTINITGTNVKYPVLSEVVLSAS